MRMTMAAGTWAAWRSRKTCIIPTSSWWCYPHIDWRAPCWEAKERNGLWIPTTVSGKWEGILLGPHAWGRQAWWDSMSPEKAEPSRGLCVTVVSQGPLASSAELFCASGRATGSKRSTSTFQEHRLGGTCSSPMPVAEAAGSCLAGVVGKLPASSSAPELPPLPGSAAPGAWHTQPPHITSTAATSPSAQDPAAHNCM